MTEFDAVLTFCSSSKKPLLGKRTLPELSRNFRRHQPSQVRKKLKAWAGTARFRVPQKQQTFFAGMAIESSMLGVCHSAANPLTAHYGVTHGVAIGVMLPHVIRFNAPAAGPLYAQLVGTVGSPLTGLVRGLNALIAGVAIQLQQVVDQGLIAAFYRAYLNHGREDLP